MASPDQARVESRRSAAADVLCAGERRTKHVAKGRAPRAVRERDEALAGNSMCRFAARPPARVRPAPAS